jgi:hypothetical protein
MGTNGVIKIEERTQTNMGPPNHIYLFSVHFGTATTTAQTTTFFLTLPLNSTI